MNNESPTSKAFTQSLRDSAASILRSASRLLQCGVPARTRPYQRKRTTNSQRQEHALRLTILQPSSHSIRRESRVSLRAMCGGASEQAPW